MPNPIKLLRIFCPTLILLIALGVFPLLAQSYLTSTPAWISELAGATNQAAFGDIDLDGDLDLVCANTDGPNVMYENRSGILTAVPVWQSERRYNSSSVALGDIDFDGDLDVVFGNNGHPNTLYVNIGGTFTSEPAWVALDSTAIQDIKLADINGDGYLDLVCAIGYSGYDTQQNSIYLNIGGTFEQTAAWRSNVSRTSLCCAVGDIDGDDDLDIVFGNNFNNTWYENVFGTITANPVWESDSTNYTHAIELGDIDGDGDLDLVTGNLLSRSGPINVYENLGNSFTTSHIWTSSAEMRIFDLALGDIDGDTDLDLVCGVHNGPNVLYLNNGTGFNDNIVWLSEADDGTADVCLGDVDGDGALDLMCANKDRANVLYENLAGAFSFDPVWISNPEYSTSCVALGDLNGNGLLDLVCGNQYRKGLTYNDPMTIYHNNGTGFDPDPSWEADSTRFIYDIALGDIDLDGDLDLAVATYESADQPEPNECYENLGGVFSSAPMWTADSYIRSSTVDVELGDVDCDGDLDLVFGNYFNINTVYENMIDSITVKPVYMSYVNWDNPEKRTFSITLGDIDDDGRLDLVEGQQYPNLVYYNNGVWFDTTATWRSIPENTTWSMAVKDMNGDGRPDLVCGNKGAANAVYFNRGVELERIPSWTSLLINDTQSIAVGDVDGDGDLDLVCGNVDGNEPCSNTLYYNNNGMLEQMPGWTSSWADYTFGTVLGDVDRDGDLDLLCGNRWENNTMYAGLRNPVYRGNPLMPVHQLPNNGTFLKNVTVKQLDANNYRATFTVFDIEADRVWIIGEYQFEGEPVWRPVEMAGGGNRYGPLVAMPGGITDSLEWNTSLIPFDERDIVLRLRVAEIPRRTGVVQHASSYLATVGRVLPRRPELTSSTDRLIFSDSALTVGDTTSVSLMFKNTGTLDLTVFQIELPSGEMRAEANLPITLAPNQEAGATIYMEPRLETEITGFMTVMSDDPVTPVDSIEVLTDIRALNVTHKLLKSGNDIPLGEAVTVIATPAPDVNVERGLLWFRSTGSPTFEHKIQLSPFENEFVAIIPGTAVTEAGLDYYIQVENSGLIATDPHGAPDTCYSQTVTAPIRITTDPIPNSGSDFLEDRDITIQVIIPTGAMFENGTLHYRQGGIHEYTAINLAAGDVFPEAVIPDSACSARGLEYWVEVNTRTAWLTDPPTDPASSPLVIPITIQNLLEPDAHAGGEEIDSYRMFGVPLEFGASFSGTIEALLSDQPEFGPYNTLKWRAWAYLPDTGGYAELNDDVHTERFIPRPGRAFWLISKQTHQIGTAPLTGVSIRTDTDFGIALQADSWNMVSCPFNFPVAWDSVRVDTFSMAEAEGVVIDPPVRWNGAYVHEITNLDPFEGYWLYNRADHNVTVWIPPEQAPAAVLTIPLQHSASAPRTSGKPPATKSDLPSAIDNCVSITAAFQDHPPLFIIAGLDSAGSVELDRFDRIHPPPIPGASYDLFFIHDREEKSSIRMSTEIRRRPATLSSNWGEIWAFDLMRSSTGRSAGDAVSLILNVMQELPPDIEVVVLDLVMDRRLGVSAQSTFEIHSLGCGYSDREQDARFRLLMGSAAFIEQESSLLLEVPVNTVVYQNYPNPFNPTTVIQYDIAQPGMVDLRIFDVTGAVVRVITHRHRDIGRFEATWDGTNEQGVRVASGVYFYRFTAPEYISTRKMVLLR